MRGMLTSNSTTGPNFPAACILGQIYYDGAALRVDSTVAVDGASGTNPQASLTPCPDASTSVPSGASGRPFPGVGQLAAP